MSLDAGPVFSYLSYLSHVSLFLCFRLFQFLLLPYRLHRDVPRVLFLP